MRVQAQVRAQVRAHLRLLRRSLRREQGTSSNSHANLRQEFDASGEILFPTLMMHQGQSFIVGSGLGQPKIDRGITISVIIGIGVLLF